MLRILIAAAVVGAGAQSAAWAQDIETDPLIKESTDRSNWEPGGQFFSLGARGSVIPSTRTGGVTVTRTNTQRLGNFSLQQGTVSGSIGYSVDLSNPHPHTVHSPFTNTTRNSASARVERPDGSQASIDLDWTGQMVHPANGYDPPAGGGFPPPDPLGAIDIYTYDISGQASGVYPLGLADQQRLDLAPAVTLNQRFQGQPQQTTTANFDTSSDTGSLGSRNRARSIASSTGEFSTSGFQLARQPATQSVANLAIAGFTSVPAARDTQVASLLSPQKVGDVLVGFIKKQGALVADLVVAAKTGKGGAGASEAETVLGIADEVARIGEHDAENVLPSIRTTVAETIRSENLGPITTTEQLDFLSTAACKCSYNFMLLRTVRKEVITQLKQEGMYKLQ